MAAIWSTDTDGGWKLQPTVGYEGGEDTLHTLVEQSPQLLPLAGSPQLAIVGREVRLGHGYADLIAVEPSGRIVIIEVKLAADAEAKQAVVAQVLAYASRIHGLTPTQFETEVLGKHLRQRGYDNLYAAATDASQNEYSEVARRQFDEGLADSLSEGRFRLVIVLDAAPQQLVHLAGYLEYVTDRLIIDLVTVAAYEVGDRKLVVPTASNLNDSEPTRASVLRSQVDKAPSPPVSTTSVKLWPRFLRISARSSRQCVTGPPNSKRRVLRYSKPAVGRSSHCRVYIPGDMSLLSVNCATTSSFQLFKSVFDRRAPRSAGRIEELIGMPFGQGTAVRAVTAELLEALTSAYQEASTGNLAT